MRSISIVHVNGFLKLQVIENRKRTLKSLKIKVAEKDWSESKQRVKDSCKDFQKHNSAIEAALKEANAFDKPNEAFPKNRTILDFWNRIIADTDNHGSRIKAETVRNKFAACLTANNRKDLPFTDLTSHVLQDFSRYAKKDCDINTVTHYLKMIKTLVNKAAKQGYFNYAYSPFAQIEFKTRKREKPVLKPQDLERMVSVHMDESDRL